MEDIITLTILAGFALLALLDVVAPARRLTPAPRWRLKGLLFFAGFVVLGTMAPLLWDGLLGRFRLVDATGLGTVGGALAGLLTLQLLSYTWHRTMHRTPFLWRWFHQMHHSAERVDVFGAFFFHPLDVLGFAFVGSLALVVVMGVSTEAALIVNGTGMLLSMFQHSNLRTPRWLGYLVQRPESHALHHARGVHAFNYGDIALWDMVFGTFRNPEVAPAEAGFHDGASRRLLEMLVGRDVSRPRAERPAGAAAVA